MLVLSSPGLLVVVGEDLLGVVVDLGSTVWAFVVKNGRINSSPVVDPSASCSSLGFLWEVSINGDKGEGIAVSTLAGMGFGGEGG